MILYKSTRGDDKQYIFSEAILKGIAQDGGLFVPETIPQFTTEQLKLLIGKSYHEQATFILDLFQTDFSKDLISKLVKKAYGSQFDHPHIAPVVRLTDKQYLLELWHGPTLAFKDMALQLMPLFFSEAVKKMNDKRMKKGEKALRYMILVATSGDTGKAALEGYRDKEFLSIMVLYPQGRVSELQKLQMVTQEGNNVSVVSVQGDFDDCQRCVKEVFADRAFEKELLEKEQVVLSSANSINWGRLLPQIVYFVSGYLELVNRNVIKLGEEIDVVVPTGNFGNILAAYYAKQMGLPISKFICASNTNNVLTKFLQTGVYDITNRRLVQTPSPSMDILIASNIERLLFLLTRDPQKVAQWMKELRMKKIFEVDEKTKQLLLTEFAADWVSNEESLANISAVYQETNYIMDPHTSVAQLVAQRLGKTSTRPILIASTAHWGKFINDVSIALGEKLVLPKQLQDLKHKKIRHTQTSEATKEAMETIIRNSLAE